MKRKSKKSGSTRSSWTVTEARANFRNLLDKAQKQGPQTISRNGHPIATIAAAGGGRKSGR